MLMIFPVLSHSIMRYISQLLSLSDKIIQKQLHLISFAMDSHSFGPLSYAFLPSFASPWVSRFHSHSDSDSHSVALHAKHFPVGNKNESSLETNEVEISQTVK